MLIQAYLFYVIFIILNNSDNKKVGCTDCLTISEEMSLLIWVFTYKLTTFCLKRNLIADPRHRNFDYNIKIVMQILYITNTKSLKWHGSTSMQIEIESLLSQLNSLYMKSLFLNFG